MHAPARVPAYAPAEHVTRVSANLVRENRGAGSQLKKNRVMARLLPADPARPCGHLRRAVSRTNDSPDEPKHGETCDFFLDWRSKSAFAATCSSTLQTELPHYL